MIKISNLKIPLDYNTKTLEKKVAKRLRISPERIEKLTIAKRSVDARDKRDVHFNMTILVQVGETEKRVGIPRKDNRISRVTEQLYTVTPKKLKERPIVVGCGPAGIFAALILAQAGTRPILLERGQDVDSRTKSVIKFWQTGVLDTATNVQFGEGGAGTFSDGKLKYGKMTPLKTKVLTELVEAGAPAEILYFGKPHIGTDRLKKTVKNLRSKIIGLGGEVRFNATVTEILRKDALVRGVGFVENGVYNQLSANNVILAIGHSARDTFKNLLNSGIFMEQKPFAIGVRIEHPQEMINRIQYGDFASHPALGAADYKLVVHLKKGRAVYSFCMCPGGSVVGATSEENCLVTNGMSEYRRNGRNSNSALIVTIGKEDLGSDHPLAGIEFQRRIEAAAFKAGGGGYKAPVQRLEDFLDNRTTTAFGGVEPTYRPGTEFTSLDSCLPGYVTGSLRGAIPAMDAWMPGFAYPDALLTGVETRSSSPVRITRGDTMEAIGIKGLYPCGEGAGYSGGIISAAVDGVLCAERVLGT